MSATAIARISDVVEATVVLSAAAGDLIAEINASHEAACRSANATLDHARRAGVGLIQAKRDLAHGAWLPWLAENCPSISRQTAQRYMRIADRWDEIEAARNASRETHLPLRQALALLAGSGMPSKKTAKEPETHHWINALGDMRNAVEKQIEPWPAATKALVPKSLRDLADIIDAENADDGIVTTPHVAHNSGNDEWYSPAEYVEAARRVMGGIDLDPASTIPANSVVKAATFYCAAANGLEQPWRGRVWLNPPCSEPLIGDFIEKLVDQYENGEIEAAILLVNNATETTWFHHAAMAANGLCLPQGRLQFWHPNGNTCSPLQGQALLYFGNNYHEFSVAFGGFGIVMPMFNSAHSAALRDAWLANVNKRNR